MARSCAHSFIISFGCTRFSGFGCFGMFKRGA